MRHGIGIALLGLLGACQSGSGHASGGHLQVHWSGREPGRLSASATAGWCAPRHVLEVRSIRGDTGVALALYPAETLTAGVYQVVEPTRAESLPPAAAVALRWLTPKVVQGFRGESGSVRLQRSSSGQVSGEMSLRARSVVDTQRVTITGSFQGLTLQLQSPRCGRPEALDEAPELPDTSVH